MNLENRRLLADLLIQWEDLYKQGQDTPASVLCKDHPELAETLARQIAALKRVSWLDDKLEDNGDEPGDDAPDDHRPPKLLAGRYRLDQLIATGGFAQAPGNSPGLRHWPGRQRLLFCQRIRRGWVTR